MLKLRTGLGEVRGGDENVAPTGGSRAGPVQHDIGERVLHEGTPRGESVRVQAFDPEPRVPVLAVRELRLGQARCCEPRDSSRSMNREKGGKGRRPKGTEGLLCHETSTPFRIRLFWRQSTVWTRKCFCRA